MQARFASTPAEAAEDASVIISMLADDEASREVWLGKDGALAVARKGAILIESSTVSPAWVAEFAKLAEQHGADLLDAPVTGSRMQAEAGQLSFLVGGKDTALAAATPVLKPMSKEMLIWAPWGAGLR
jgi:3-hydroxyisobutyrate dehydrogenase